MRPRSHIRPGYEYPAPHEYDCSFCGERGAHVRLSTDGRSACCGDAWCAEELLAEQAAANAAGAGY